MKQESTANRLADESSPYLRQHAGNPVDWYPWGPEALARARAEDRPILLSVGYSACHWCHVMAHESFENSETAQRMNRAFVCIKVDREERPDVDQLYQGVVQLMGRGGGWPLTVFLTPDLRPFFGGTYFPPVDRYGMAGFPKVLEALNDAWLHRRGEVLKQAEEFQAGLNHVATHGLEADLAALGSADVVRAAQELGSAVDAQNGGFGGAPKFPNPMNVALLLRGHRRGGGDALLQAALLTLRRMAEGGIYDQLGGGFHRYAVDAAWRVPHFEKMLYDNAQLLHLYAEAQQIRPDPRWQQVVEETAAYIHREMTSREGAFFTAQDADSEGEEGRFFVWKPEEIRAELGERLAEVALRHFGVTPEGNFEGGRSVLEVRVPLDVLGEDERLAVSQARTLLLAARERRVHPGLDDKVLAGWNGLMIRGLAFAGQVFDRPEWIAWAAAAADFVLARMRRPDGTLWRVFHGGQAKVEAFLEDYGDLAAGLVALYQASFEPRYLEAAEALARIAVARFFDAERGAYFTASPKNSELPVATYGMHDNAFPSGASTLTEAQVQLAGLTGRPEHLAQAERYLLQMAKGMRENPFAYGHLWLSGDAFLEGAVAVVLVGGKEALMPFLNERRRLFAPAVSWAALDPTAIVPEVLQPTAEGKGLVAGRGAAFLCRHFACERPVTEPAELVRQLAYLSSRTLS